MLSLLIRNVDATLHTRLKERAAAHGCSLEEEVRGLLRAATARQTREENVVDVARRLFGPKHGVDLDTPLRGNAPQRPPPDFANPDSQR